MPTGAKLVAAVCFAIVGWLAAEAYIPQLPADTRTGYFREIMAVLGFVLGWMTLGPNVGRGYGDAASIGMRTSFLLVFWGLLGMSIYFMVRRSTRMIYDNAGDAALDVPMLMLQYAGLMGSVPLIAVLALGGAIGGVLTEFAGRRWK
jgi:hypothetical protein